MTEHKMKVLADAEVENEFEDAKSLTSEGIHADGWDLLEVEELIWFECSCGEFESESVLEAELHLQKTS